MSLVGRRYVVRGRVQGVGFRAFVRDLAESLELRGEVWNRRDGSVEARVFSPNLGLIEGFAEALRGGPGWVEEVVEEPLSGSPDAAGFRIGATR